MANCCSEEKCKKLLTVKDISTIVSNAMFMDCTNYESGGSITYSGCCSGDYDEYSPNFIELTQNTSGDTIWFQNWESGSTGYDDLDGIIISDPGWDDHNDCCSGSTNVSLENIKFKYARFKNFTVNGSINVDGCYTGNSISNASFLYLIERREVDGCELTDTKIGDDISINYNSSKSIWGDVISAISVNSTNNWISYDNFSKYTTGDIEINSSNIFRPIFSRKNLSITYDNCKGITATSSPSNATVYIMPKFRDCVKNENYDYYTISKSGINGSFSWNNTGFCNDESSYIDKNGIQIAIGYYRGNIGEPSLNLTKVSGKDIDNITVSANGGTITLNVGKNSDARMRRFTVSVKFKICNNEYESSCDFCQEKGVNVIPIQDNCCNGFVSIIPPIMCGDSIS